jgi:hypothetical protein
VTTYDPIERVRRARRQAATIAGLVALMVALLLVLVVRLWTGRTTTPPDASSGVIASDGGPDLQWRSYRPGQDLPESRTAGPSRHVEGRVAGFAHSQLGAALAAIHIGTRVDPTAGPAVFEPTIHGQVVGTDVERLAEQTSARYDQGRQEQGKGPGEPLDPGKARLAAFKVESYLPDSATVDMITAYEDHSQYFSFRYEVRWVNDDWHLVAPPEGDMQKVLNRLPALPPGAVALSRGT